MIHGIEEALEVKVYYIYVACIDYFLRPSQCVMTTSSWTAEAVASPRELALIDRGQNLVNGLLHHTVYHGDKRCLNSSSCNKALSGIRKSFLS